MFQPEAVGLHSFVAMMMALAYVFNACLSAIAIRFVVARAKKCWDFGATIYIIHFGCTWLVDGFPQRALWWALMGACAAVTILLGEFLCVQFEMADIPMTGLGASAASVLSTQTPRSSSTVSHLWHVSHAAATCEAVYLQQTAVLGSMMRQLLPNLVMLYLQHLMHSLLFLCHRC